MGSRIKVMGLFILFFLVGGWYLGCDPPRRMQWWQMKVKICNVILVITVTGRGPHPSDMGVFLLVCFLELVTMFYHWGFEWLSFLLGIYNNSWLKASWRILFWRTRVTEKHGTSWAAYDSNMIHPLFGKGVRVPCPQALRWTATDDIYFGYDRNALLGSRIAAVCQESEVGMFPVSSDIVPQTLFVESIFGIISTRITIPLFYKCYPCL